jgi:hypothetical protein
MVQKMEVKMKAERLITFISWELRDWGRNRK